MYGKMKDHLSKTLAEIKEAGLYKEERLIESAQQAAISVKGKEGAELLCQQLPGTVQPPAADCRRPADYGTPRIRHVVRTLHLRNAGHPQGTGSSHLRLLQD